MNQFSGMRVIASPLIPDQRPRVQLRASVPVSDAFRVEMDAWLAEFFGYETFALVMDLEALGIGQGSAIALSRANYAKLRGVAP